MTTANVQDILEQLVSAAEADGWTIYARGANLWYEFPDTPSSDDRSDAIERLNIALADPVNRAAIVPHLYATGRSIPTVSAA